MKKLRLLALMCTLFPLCAHTSTQQENEPDPYWRMPDIRHQPDDSPSLRAYKKWRHTVDDQVREDQINAIQRRDRGAQYIVGSLGTILMAYRVGKRFQPAAGGLCALSIALSLKGAYERIQGNLDWKRATARSAVAATAPRPE